jgi:hypothetical protein
MMAVNLPAIVAYAALQDVGAGGIPRQQLCREPAVNQFPRAVARVAVLTGISFALLWLARMNLRQLSIT